MAADGPGRSRWSWTSGTCGKAFLEVSGANPVRQMMAMIETTRAFEANTRMIQNQDSVTGTLISRALQASEGFRVDRRNELVNLTP